MARAQIEALRHRVPFLYAIIAINVIALSYTHYAANPLWLDTLLPGVLVAVILLRAVRWARVKPSRMTDRQIAAARRSTAIAGPIIGVVILAWALSLQHSPTLPTRLGALTDTGHSIFFVGITIVSCIFLLTHHRLAAIAVGLAVVIPFVMILLANRQAIETAIALNILLVTAAMLYVAVSFSRHFDQSVIDAADLLRLSAVNSRLAAADALTSLPNRRQFFRELEAAGASKAAFAVIVCDLDGFKQVNDVYGHLAGDDVLREIATRLLAVAPEGSCVARMGGDEFTCLVVGDASRSAQLVAERFIARCSEPMAFDAFTVQVGASAGLCYSPAGALWSSSLAYERADYALIDAKRAGRGRVEMFDEMHDRSMLRAGSVGRLLRSADLERELDAVYQPIVDAATYDVRGFEALVRWTSPELGPVGPSEFIPIAERTDLILSITRIMLRVALGRAASWPDHVMLKMNLSIRDLMSAEQTRALLAELGRSMVAPGRVTFEITETILAESLKQIRSNVDVLRAAGCKIAIDDFGVGYSSLNYIHMLAPDVIKIDRCFIDQIATNDVTRRVVRTIVELARNVGAVSVAEGVETAAQARLLAELGCNELQGYHFSKPVSAEVSVTMARSNTVSASGVACFSGRDRDIAVSRSRTTLEDSVSG